MKTKKIFLGFLLVAAVFSFIPSVSATMVPVPPATKTLGVGETWNVLCGYTLTAQSIDVRASPRQVWLVLSKDGTRLNEAVLAEGQVYTYGSIISTKVNSIFAGASTDMVRLINTSVNSMLPLQSGLPAPLFKKTLATGETWSVCRGYEITANSIDARASPRQVWFVLSKDGMKLDDVVLAEGTVWNYTERGVVILTTKVDSIFAGATSDMVQLKNTSLNTYDLLSLPCTESWSCGPWSACASGQQTRTCTDANGCGTTNNRPAITQSCSIVSIDGKKTLTVGEMWDICGGYDITAQSIDARASPRQVWLIFKKDNVALNEMVLAQGQSFNFSNSSELIFSAKIDSIFAGATNDMVQFKNMSVNSKILARHERKTLAVGETWNFCAGYGMEVGSIDARSSPRQVWLIFRKNGIKYDDRVLAQGQFYDYSELRGIFSTKIDSIFAGATSDMVQLVNTTLSPAAIINTTTPTCAEFWLCTDWSPCANGQQTRNCTDNSICGSTNNRPPLNQSCAVVPACNESWSCGPWSSCASGEERRICADANSCGTTINKPETIRACLAGCTESWSCGEWSGCADGLQTRICTDVNNCGTTNDKPDMMQKCAAECVESWSCGEWSACVDGKQKRVCTDENNCGTTSKKPANVQTCAAPTCTESWYCDDWSSCKNGQQIRDCREANKCGTEKNRPEMKRECGVQGVEGAQENKTNATGITLPEAPCKVAYALLGLFIFIIMKR